MDTRLAGEIASATGYHHLPAPDAVHYGVPSSNATVIIAFDQPLDVGWADHTGGRDRFWLLASGLHTAPALIRTHGLQHGIQLSLTPLGCRRLLGVPIGALRRNLVHHGDLPSGITEYTYERLVRASAWRERFTVLTEALLAGRDENRSIASELDHAWSLIARRHGVIRVDELAAEVGWSRRQLSKRFGAEFGVTPKEAARLQRFEFARQLVADGSALAHAAAAAGYADQAHLSREWRGFAGQSPRAHLTEQFPIVQDHRRASGPR